MVWQLLDWWERTLFGHLRQEELLSLLMRVRLQDAAAPPGAAVPAMAVGAPPGQAMPAYQEICIQSFDRRSRVPTVERLEPKAHPSQRRPTVTPAIADRSEEFSQRAAPPQRRTKCCLSLCIFHFFHFSFSAEIHVLGVDIIW